MRDDTNARAAAAKLRTATHATPPLKYGEVKTQHPNDRRAHAPMTNSPGQYLRNTSTYVGRF